MMAESKRDFLRRFVVEAKPVATPDVVWWLLDGLSVNDAMMTRLREIVARDDTISVRGDARDLTAFAP